MVSGAQRAPASEVLKRLMSVRLNPVLAYSLSAFLVNSQEMFFSKVIFCVSGFINIYNPFNRF